MRVLILTKSCFEFLDLLTFLLKLLFKSLDFPVFPVVFLYKLLNSFPQLQKSGEEFFFGEVGSVHEPHLPVICCAECRFSQRRSSPSHRIDILARRGTWCSPVVRPRLRLRLPEDTDCSRHAAETLLDGKKGDCDDKAVLLVGLLLQPRR